VSASRGKWIAKRHLLEMDNLLFETLGDPLSPRILLIEVPPRCGKSEFWSKWVPAWYLGTFPDNRVMLTSYESKFAKQWGRKVRDILIEHGQEYFGHRLQRDNKSASEWSIYGHEGGMQTAGAGGSLTGKGSDLLLVDDPIANSETAKSAKQLDDMWDWWLSTVDTRLEPGGIAVVIATRWADKDLTGRLIAASLDGTGKPISRLRLPAIAEINDPIGRAKGEALWPERYPIEVLEQIQRAKGPYWWNALYQQKPGQKFGTAWPEEYFDKHLLTPMWPETFDIAVGYLDPSLGKTDKSDFSALIFLGLSGGRFWVDCNIKRRPVSQMISDGFWFMTGRKIEAFGIESNVFQELLAPEFDRFTRELNTVPLPLILINNKVNKQTRIHRLGPYLARKHIVIRDNEGGRLLVQQMKDFPLGDHDDGPDGLEGAIRLLVHLANQGGQEETVDEIANV